MLTAWAELLLEARWSRDVVELHLKDSAAAFFAGASTAEGRALSKYYERRADLAEIAAGAASIARLSECDDIHLASCVTPGAAVVPVALAFVDGRGEEQLHRAIGAGYAAGLMLGTAVGGAKALAAGAWPSLLAAPVMAAVTASCIRGFDAQTLAHAIAIALSGASGRLGRPHGSPSGRWFAFAEAVLKGIRAAEAARAGFRGDLSLVSQGWLATQAGHGEADVSIFETAGPSIVDVGFKPFPVARQGANAVVAFQAVMSKGLDPARIQSVEVYVPAMNATVLSRPASTEDRLSRISNVGFQLACAALAPAMLYDVERSTHPLGPLLEFAGRVSVKSASDLDAHLPDRWPARVVVQAGGGRCEETVARAPFDRDGEALQLLLGQKWRRLLTNSEHWQALNHSPIQPAPLWQEVERCVSMSAKRP